MTRDPDLVTEAAGVPNHLVEENQKAAPGNDAVNTHIIPADVRLSARRNDVRRIRLF